MPLPSEHLEALRYKAWADARLHRMLAGLSNHATYCRGRIAAMLNHSGVQPQAIDLPVSRRKPRSPPSK